MKQRNNAGFTLIELMIVVAIIAIIAAIAIPKLMSARISANENAAIAALRTIASAQAQLQSSGAIDTDADGGGEFGFFGELAGSANLRIFDTGIPGPNIGVDPLNPPILPTGFGQVIAGGADGIVERQGYYFKIYLPGVPTGGATPAVAEDPAGGAKAGDVSVANWNTDDTEIMWAAYAWPVDAEKTGNRVFFINQEGDILQHLNLNGLVEGTGGGPAFDDALTAADFNADLAIAALGLASVNAGDAEGWTWAPVGN